MLIALADPLMSASPNIVFLLCDDLGYGDVQSLNPAHGKIATPGMDRLASQGMAFTDAHSPSAVCTPSRYGVMTGRYSWRTSLQAGVVVGFAPSLIAADRPTVAGFLKEQGYQTAILGKWHLDFQYLDPKTGEAYSAKDYSIPPVGAKIPDGPVSRGFDSYVGFHHARNMEAVIENDTVVEHDEAVNMLPRLRRKAVEFLDSRRDQKQPFFLYLAVNSPHTPILPSPEWKGRSGLGDYGDFVMQTDDTVAAVSDALERNGMAENTLFIVTSDNGCSKEAGIEKLAAQGHFVSAQFRGSKADIWDGGHRVPFIARWPGQIPAGTTSSQLICLLDLFATAADILGQPTPAGSCEDSVSFLPAFHGRPVVSTRNGVIHHSVSGHFAYRQGPWKLCLAKGSGGWSSPTEAQMPEDAPKGQLYNLADDIGETHNLFESKPEIVNQLLGLLKSDVERGRSTAGPHAVNDVDKIVLWKSEKRPSQKEAPASQGAKRSD